MYFTKYPIFYFRCIKYVSERHVYNKVISVRVTLRHLFFFMEVKDLAFIQIVPFFYITL